VEKKNDSGLSLSAFWGVDCFISPSKPFIDPLSWWG
jgi:hypothetical protein